MKSLIKRFSVLICIFMMISFAGCSISVDPNEDSSGNTGGVIQAVLMAVPQKAAVLATQVLLAALVAQVLHKILLLQKKSKIIFPLH